MKSADISRRLFLQASGSLASTNALRTAIPGLAALLQAACSARDEHAPFEILASDEARELEAIVARIIPTTDTPGAREAGVIWFIDKALGDFMSGRRDFLRSELESFERPIAEAFPAAERFSDLSEDDQDKYLATRDQTPFFQVLHMMTLFGMFGLPDYGGNADHAGWNLLGIDPHQHAFQPPFGYYDAQSREEQKNGD